MGNVLIIYATNHGHTAKVAARIAETVRDDGARVGIHDIDSADDCAPSGYDVVIVGASVHAGHHQRPVVDWVKRHATALNGMPSVFFSVSLGAAEDTEESRSATRKYIDDFLDDTGWSPRQAVSVAGALQYREYDFATRLLMRLIMRRGGHPTDASHDYVYTDWDAVDRFAHECASMTEEGQVSVPS